ncbi:MAG: hypothetical protein ACRCWM_01745 [Sarcina sp.]
MDRYFEEYKKLSLKVLEELDKDGFSNLESFQEEKQNIIFEVAGLGLSPETVRENLEKFDIINLEQKIIEKMAIKKAEIKEKTNEIARRKSANNVYANAGRQIQYLNSVR